MRRVPVRPGAGSRAPESETLCLYGLTCCTVPINGMKLAHRAGVCAKVKALS